MAKAGQRVYRSASYSINMYLSTFVAGILTKWPFVQPSPSKRQWIGCRQQKANLLAAGPTYIIVMCVRIHNFYMDYYAPWRKSSHEPAGKLPIAVT